MLRWRKQNTRRRNRKVTVTLYSHFHSKNRRVMILKIQNLIKIKLSLIKLASETQKTILHLYFKKNCITIPNKMSISGTRTSYPIYLSLSLSISLTRFTQQQIFFPSLFDLFFFHLSSLNFLIILSITNLYTVHHQLSVTYHRSPVQ